MGPINYYRPIYTKCSRECFSLMDLRQTWFYDNSIILYVLSALCRVFSEMGPMVCYGPIFIKFDSLIFSLKKLWQTEFHQNCIFCNGLRRSEVFFWSGFIWDPMAFYTSVITYLISIMISCHIRRVCAKFNSY